MSNSVVATLVHDGGRNAVYNLTGILDTADYAVTPFTDISVLVPRPKMLRLDHMFYSVEDGISVRFYWESIPNVLIFPVEGRGKADFDWFGGFTNVRESGFTGNLCVGTQGYASGTYAFAFVLEFTKQ